MFVLAQMGSRFLYIENTSQLIKAYFLYFDMFMVVIIFVCATLQLSLVKIADFQYYKYDKVAPDY
jgi:hypothetical protein